MSKHIGKILTDIIPEQHHWKVKLLGSWEEIIGKLKDKVRIEKITESSLVLGVCHSTWAQELFFLSPMLKKKINSVLQENKIKKIQFKTVQLKKEKNNTNKERVKSDRMRQSIDHSLNIIEHNTLQTMDNQGLATALEAFYIRCKRVKAMGEES